jgi:hypothetical protein|tara:strand:+ start:463 stop:711 length:249 start_codon:yes stop_codon:yes gene_type:complete
MANKLKMGRYIEYPKYREEGHRTIANLYLSLMLAAGMQTPETFGQPQRHRCDRPLGGVDGVNPALTDRHREDVQKTRTWAPV